MKAYLESLETRHYSPETIASRALYLRYLLLWCHERGIDTVREISKPLLERYQRHLFLYRTNKGKPLCLSTQAGRMSAIANFFCWLTKHNYIPADPASSLDRPRGAKRLPGQAMTIEEAEAVLSQPNCTTLMGFRDRTILELLYATAIRRSELCNLSLVDIEWGRSALWVRQGKGKKDRVVPLGERAKAWLEVYRDHVRPQLACGLDDQWLFIGRHGQKIFPKKITGWIGDYIKAAAIAKSGSCHLLRHAAATLMLEGGADIRYIQALLGHSDLGTTQVYTHISITQLQAVHSQTHPGAKTVLDKTELKELILGNSSV